MARVDGDAPRELILLGLAEGASLRQVARNARVSVGTVERVRDSATPPTSAREALQRGAARPATCRCEPAANTTRVCLRCGRVADG